MCWALQRSTPQHRVEKNYGDPVGPFPLRCFESRSSSTGLKPGLFCVRVGQDGSKTYLFKLLCMRRLAATLFHGIPVDRFHTPTRRRSSVDSTGRRWIRTDNTVILSLFGRAVFQHPAKIGRVHRISARLYWHLTDDVGIHQDPRESDGLARSACVTVYSRIISIGADDDMNNVDNRYAEI